MMRVVFGFKEEVCRAGLPGTPLVDYHHWIKGSGPQISGSSLRSYSSLSAMFSLLSFCVGFNRGSYPVAVSASYHGHLASRSLGRIFSFLSFVVLLVCVFGRHVVGNIVVIVFIWIPRHHAASSFPFAGTRAASRTTSHVGVSPAA